MAPENYKRYDLHCHTRYSACSMQSVRDVLKVALKRNLSGLAITDHNQIAGALEAQKLLRHEFKEAFSRKRFELVVGEEILTDRCEVLAYYLNERIRPGNFYDVIEQIREQGAICSIAHPYTLFRKGFKGDISKVRSKVDALECFNSRNLIPGRNRMAERMAERLSLGKTAGSDAHSLIEIGRAYTLFSPSLSLEKAIRIRKAFVQGTSFFSPPGFVISAISKKMR